MIIHLLKMKMVNQTNHRYPNLVGADVHVWTDDRSCSIIHSFTHHVFPEQSLFFFKDLEREGGQLTHKTLFNLYVLFINVKSHVVLIYFIHISDQYLAC